MSNHWVDWVMGGGILGIVAMVFKNGKDADSKVSRIYQRFDEYKQHLEGRMVSKDVCEVHTQQMISDIKDIKQDVKELLRRNGG